MMLCCTHPEHVGGRVLPLDNFSLKRNRRGPKSRGGRRSWHQRRNYCRVCCARSLKEYRQRAEVKRADRLAKKLRRLERRHGIEHARVRRVALRTNFRPDETKPVRHTGRPTRKARDRGEFHKIPKARYAS